MKVLTTLLLAMLLPGFLLASSHREAPEITKTPKVDATDFYVFNSYEPGREDFLILAANYQPLQDAYGGPNYFTMDEKAVYDIHLDCNGNNCEDISFRFKFNNQLKGLAVPTPGGSTNAVPLRNIGPFTAGNTGALNVIESYTVDVVNHLTGTSAPVTGVGSFNTSFIKPSDNIGNKSITNYNAYANAHIYAVNYPGFGQGRVFVGQRKDPFAVNLGEIFDLVNLNPLGPPDGARNILEFKNVTTLMIEVPKAMIQATNNVCGAWTTASLNGKQVSRLSAPLVNEVVIGLPDKDAFNASHPAGDAQFLDYVDNPTLPVLLNVLFGVTAPTHSPRADLRAAFLTGIPGINANGGFSEMMRINLGTPPTAKGSQNNLGLVAGDAAGFPNGRRPGDDVVDIELRAAMGFICHLGLGVCNTNDAPSGLLAYTDGAAVSDADFPDTFPFFNDPCPGSPNSATVMMRMLTASGPDKAFQPAAIRVDQKNGTIIAPALDDPTCIYKVESDPAVKFQSIKRDAEGWTFKVAP